MFMVYVDSQYRHNFTKLPEIPVEWVFCFPRGKTEAITKNPNWEEKVFIEIDRIRALCFCSRSVNFIPQRLLKIPPTQF